MLNQEYEVKNKEFFERWRLKHLQKYGQVGFVTDGIVDLNEFWNSEERIMFLLKEAYDKSGTPIDWDEVKWLKQVKCTDNCTKNVSCDKCTITGNTFNFIASVVYGMTESSSNNYDSWLGTENNNSEYKTKRRELLKKIAIVNIKKSGGKSQSSDDDIYYYASDDKEFLIEQIKLINPTLIICGGTYKYLRCILTDLPRFDDTDNGSCIYDSIKIISAPHPNSRGSCEEKYSDILTNLNKL